MKYFKQNKIFIIIFTVVLILVFMPGHHSVLALTDGGKSFAPQEANNLAQFLSWILIMITGVMGSILTMIIGLIDTLFGWSNNIKISGINKGWVAVRDVCNMFFILIMLLIAFATILRYENYSIKRNLPKLIIAAVLINFSKTISYLLIDFSNIAMAQFASAFVGAPGNFVAMLGLDKLTAINNTSGLELDSWAVLYGVGLFFVVILISLIVMVMIVAILTMRMIMFWVLIVLSPLAIFSFAMPSGGYFSKWWGEFSKYLIVGPVLAFFVWLALITLGGNQMFNDIRVIDGKVVAVGDKVVNNANKDQINNDLNNIFVNQFSDPQDFLNFILAIGFLIGGMKITQSFGTIGGGVGMNMVGKVKSAGIGAAKKYTGYNAVADTAKGYMAMKKSKRDDRIRLASESLAKGIGTAKKNTIGLVGKGVSKLNKETLGRVTGSKKAEQAEKRADQGENTLAEARMRMSDKKDFNLGASKYKYHKDIDQWEEDNGMGTVFWNNEDVEDDFTSHEKTIENDRKLANNYRERQRKVDKVAKYGLGVLGAGAGMALTGGTGLIGALGMGAGYLAGRGGVPKIAENIRNAGKEDLGLASAFNMKQISSERDGLKEMSHDEVIAKMNDSTENSFTRAAAAMEAVSRKLVDLDTAKRKQEEMNSSFNGDKKVMGQFEALLEKNYVGASKIFRDLENGKPEEKEKAKRDIRSNYEGGVYNLKDMDSKSIGESILESARGLKTGKFMAQFKDLDASKQAYINNSLKKKAGETTGDDSYALKEKLANTTDIDNAFGAGANTDKTKFTQNLNLDKLQEILAKGTAKQRKALIEAIHRDKSNLSEQVQEAMKNGNNRIAQSVKGDLGVNIPNNP